MLTKKQIHSVLPNDQLLRAWDNVPKKAKAQEITANRIIYGNYTHLLFIDADIGFSEKSIFRMLDFDKDVVAGIYPRKAIDWRKVKKNHRFQKST